MQSKYKKIIYLNLKQLKIVLLVLICFCSSCNNNSFRPEYDKYLNLSDKVFKSGDRDSYDKLVILARKFDFDISGASIIMVNKYNCGYAAFNMYDKFSSHLANNENYYIDNLEAIEKFYALSYLAIAINKEETNALNIFKYYNSLNKNYFIYDKSAGVLVNPNLIPHKSLYQIESTKPKN